MGLQASAMQNFKLLYGGMHIIAPVKAQKVVFNSRQFGQAARQSCLLPWQRSFDTHQRPGSRSLMANNGPLIRSNAVKKRVTDQNRAWFGRFGQFGRQLVIWQLVCGVYKNDQKNICSTCIWHPVLNQVELKHLTENELVFCEMLHFQHCFGGTQLKHFHKWSVFAILNFSSQILGVEKKTAFFITILTAFYYLWHIWNYLAQTWNKLVIFSFLVSGSFFKCVQNYLK